MKGRDNFLIKYLFDRGNFRTFQIQLFELYIFTHEFVWTRALKNFTTQAIPTWV